MSDINTIKVIFKPGKYEMVINESDFDSEIHEKIGEKPAKNGGKKGKVSEDELKELIGEE